MNLKNIEIDLANAAATQALGYRLGRGCPAGTVLLLGGNLGSGKTTLVQGLGLGLGITEPISSPTFTLINEYLEGRISLYHVDLYRLEPGQVGSLELESYWEGAETTPGIVAIEWAERLGNPPPGAIHLTLSILDQGGRRATLTVGDTQREMVEEVLGHGLLADEI